MYFRETRTKRVIGGVFRRSQEDNSLILKNYDKHFSGNIYRTYSFLNLLDLEYVKQSILKDEEFFINDDTILSAYEGHTVFSIFLQKLVVYE